MTLSLLFICEKNLKNKYDPGLERVTNKNKIKSEKTL